MYVTAPSHVLLLSHGPVDEDVADARGGEGDASSGQRHDVGIFADVRSSECYRGRNGPCHDAGSEAAGRGDDVPGS